MVNREQIQGRWNEVKGRLREHWGELSENDLQQARGNAEQLVGVVQEKTGASRNEIEQFLDRLLGNTLTDQVSETAQQYAAAAQEVAADTAERMRDGYRQVSERTGDYSAKFADTVRTRPAESLAIAFGVGLAAGALLFFGRKK